MTFNTVPYLLLLVVAVAAFWLLPLRLRRIFVLLSSVAFYGSWGLPFVWLPLLVAGIVYVIGSEITRHPDSGKRWMQLGVSGVLVLLIVFKYRAFLMGNVSGLGTLLGMKPISFAASIAFPVGISFYTFEAIAYLVDLRQGRVKMPNFLDLCLFFFFWPNILSGPIVRAKELVPQLRFGKMFEARFVFEGADRIIWGLVQKNVIANVLGTWVDRGFSANGVLLPTMDGWFLAIAFALQIYFDFAAYSNMAIGTARLLGVSLPENFRQPYHAGTPAEFWTRWHMTLSRWIRDYLFFPINAKWKGAPLPLYLSLLGVMALVGLWHGAGWGFIVWGLLHGCYLVMYRFYDEEWKVAWAGRYTTPVISGTWRILTLLGITVAWVPFRAPTMQKAGTILLSMFYKFGSGRTFGLAFYIYVAAVVLFCAAEPLLMKKLGEFEEQSGSNGLSMFRVVGRPIAYLSGLALFLLFDEQNTQFIYSKF